MGVAIDRWWLRVYLTFSPVGALTLAAIIAGVAGAWPPWGNRDDLELFGALVTLGLACYGSIIWISELIGEAMLRALSGYKTRRKSEKMKVLRIIAESQPLNLDAITPEQLRKLGLEELDLEDLRDKEPTQR